MGVLRISTQSWIYPFRHHLSANFTTMLIEDVHQVRSEFQKKVVSIREDYIRDDGDEESWILIQIGRYFHQSLL